MKFLIIVSIFILTVGLLLKEEYFTVNIHDTYYITSYIYIAVFLVVLLNLVALLKYLLKRNLRR